MSDKDLFQATVMQVDGQINEGQELDAQGHEVRVTIIQGGRSKNGFVYDTAALQRIAELLEGAQAYADHARTNADQQTRSVRDIVGFYHDARYVAAAGTNARERVEATLHILEAAEWLWLVIREACQLGRPELIGLSIDIYGQWQQAETRATKGQAERKVTQVLALNSCDIVTRPSAGGALQRILHATTIPSSATEEYSPFGGPLPMTLENQGTLLSEASTSTAQEHTRIQEMEQELQTLKHELQRERAEVFLERRLLESQLPDTIKKHLRTRYQGRHFEQQELESELQAQQELLASLSAEGLIRDNRHEKASVTQMISEAEKMQAAFDRMLELEIDTARLGPIRGFTSIREAYARVTGDASVVGISERSTLGSIRVAEEAPLVRISEADTTTASFSYLLGTSMNKRLLKDYQAWPAEWMRFATIVPIRDFKQQARVRLGAFGSLPIVAEDNAYNAVALGDSAAIYVPQKRGNLVTVSREAIINDDLQAIRQLPTKLAVAAAYTLAEFVYGLLTSNSTIYDGSALFTSGTPHTNLGATALSTSALQSGVTAMRAQTNYAGKRIGLRPRYLVVPPELEWVSMIVTKSGNVPGSNNNDINPMQGYVTPIVSPQISSATQWYLVADPREVDTIEVGFVGGQVNPTLFIQDQPLVGLNFTQDAITFKIRHEYGGTVVDFRGLYRGN